MRFNGTLCQSDNDNMTKQWREEDRDGLEHIAFVVDGINVKLYDCFRSVEEKVLFAVQHISMGLAIGICLLYANVQDRIKTRVRRICRSASLETFPEWSHN